MRYPSTVILSVVTKGEVQFDCEYASVDEDVAQCRLPLLFPLNGPMSILSHGNISISRIVQLYQSHV